MEVNEIKDPKEFVEGVIAEQISVSGVCFNNDPSLEEIRGNYFESSDYLEH